MTLFNVLLSSTLLTFVSFLMLNVLVFGFSDKFINTQVMLFMLTAVFIMVSGITTIMIICK